MIIKLTEWLDYWNASHMVNTDQIKTVADMHKARRFCSCMSHSLFWDVTDEEMFAALERYRAARAGDNRAFASA